MKKISCFDEDKPVISELLTSSKLSEGKRYFLACHISNGKEPNTFEWLLNGQKVIQNDNIIINQGEDHSILNIKSMSPRESGDYTCNVRNFFGQDNKTISVKLNGKPNHF